jgi:hypothetical protein
MAVDLTEKRFGKLVAKYTIPKLKNNKAKRRYWFCVCDCGEKTTVSSSDLLSGNTKSCGCYQKEIASKCNTKQNIYDLSKEFGIGYTFKNEEFYFDLEDYDKIKDFCWYIETRGRVCARNKNSNKTPYKLHRIVMNVFDSSIEIDHKNRNQRDNRKSNLRICTHKENLCNQSLSKANKTGIIGVAFRKDTEKYIAYIMVDNKSIKLGNYKNIDDAIIARLKAEKEYFKEFAPQIHLFEKYNI